MASRLSACAAGTHRSPYTVRISGAAVVASSTQAGTVSAISSARARLNASVMRSFPESATREKPANDTAWSIDKHNDYRKDEFNKKDTGLIVKRFSVHES